MVSEKLQKPPQPKLKQASRMTMTDVSLVEVKSNKHHFVGATIEFLSYKSMPTKMLT